MGGVLNNARMKATVKTKLLQYIYDHIDAQFKTVLHKIGIEQRASNKTLSYCTFRYKNILYEIDSFGLKQASFLHSSLFNKMEEYLHDKRLVDEEKQIIVHYINQVLNSSNYLYDYIRILPETLHTSISAIMQQHPYHNNTDTQLIPCKINEINNNNKEAILLIKKRLLLNLIT